MKKKGIKRALAFILTLCMMVTGVYGVDENVARVSAASVTDGNANTSTTVYFYNSEGWGTVGAHAYSGGTALMGEWGTVTASASEALGANWYELKVPSSESFRVIFFNTASDGDRTEVAYTKDSADVYGNMYGKMYSSASEAQNAIDNSTKVYFLNSNDWTNVYAYGYDDGTHINGMEWLHNPAKQASELGGKWYKAYIPQAADQDDFVMVFHDGADIQVGHKTITSKTGNYMTASGELFATKEEAENSTKTTVYLLTTQEWGTIHATAATAAETLLNNAEVTRAASLGENWWQITAPVKATEVPFTITFTDGTNEKTASITAQNVYLTDAENGQYTTRTDAEIAAGVLTPTTIYFYNSENWNEVGIHAYGSGGDYTGGWGTTKMKQSSIGEGWYEATIKAEPEMDVIIFNVADDTKRLTSTVANTTNVYFTLSGAYTSAEEAMSTTVYLLTTKEWGTIRATAASATETFLSNEAVLAVEGLEKNWWKIKVPVNATDVPFTITFTDGTNERVAAIATQDVYLTDTDEVQYTSHTDAEIAAGVLTTTRVWFYNVYGYDTIKVHAWNTVGDIFASDPSAIREAENSNWYYVDVPAEPPFNVQFISGTNKQEGYVQNGNVYLAATDNFFSSKAEAEEFMANVPTVIYFLNHDGDGTVLEKVYAYAYTAQGALVGEFPGAEAQPAAEMGENWWRIEVDKNALLQPFTVLLSGGTDQTKLKEISVNNYKDNYVTAVANDTAIYKTKNAAALTVGLGVTTKIYLLNNKDWSNTSVYIYGNEGEVLGGWPGQQPVASAIGEKWLEIEIPAPTPFSLIFFNKDNDEERTELVIQNAHTVYVTGSGSVFGSQYEAEAAVGMISESELTTVYFYNSRGWDKGDINAYSFRKIGNDSVAIGKAWPGEDATKAPEIGDNWWKVIVPVKRTALSAENAFYVIFNDGVNQTGDCLINDPNKLYVIPTTETFATPQEAQTAAANDPYDDNCQEGSNADVTNYIVNYNGAGASLPYITYEAEAAKTNAEILEKNATYRVMQSEASGRQAVKLDATGEYVEFELAQASNSLVLRYSIPDTASGLGQDATLSMYVGNEEKQDLKVTSKYAWLYGAFPYNNNVSQGKAHFFYDEVRVLFDEVLPAGTKIRLQKDAADTAEYYVIDFIECELVAAPLEQPANSLSVTEFGAVANDGRDDRAAFEACIAAAKVQGKEVWIPAGTFDLVDKKVIEAFGVTIRGAGMWYTNLYGAGAAFKYEGTSKFYDFAMTGVSTVRNDDGDLAGIEGTGSRATNVTIQNIWMEHMKVGVWPNNTENMVIQGCRIRNTYADGINLNSATVNAIIRNNNLRNTGDDCIAIWPWMADCTGNLITHNTIQVPSLANGIAIYGGGNNVVDGNYVADTISNGAGIVVGSEFEIAEKEFTGTTTVKNNVLDRCGSVQVDEHYEIGAIWIWSSARFFEMHRDINVFNNTMNDCPLVGITIECDNPLTNVNIQNNTINGATNAVYEYHATNEGTGVGSGKIGNLTTSNITGALHKDEAPKFDLKWTDETIADNSTSDNGNTLTSEEKQAIYNAAIASMGIKLSSSAKALLETLFTDYELQRLEAGVKMYIDIVTEIMVLSDTEKELIAPFLGDLTIGVVYDINLFKVIGETGWRITELGEGNDILLTIDVPEQYRGKNYEFWIFRVHNGEVTKLPDLDNDPNTITFSTNGFSTYALAFEESGTTQPGTTQPGTTQPGATQPGTANSEAKTNITQKTATVASPGTGDTNNYLWAFAVLAVGAALVGCSKGISRKKR